MNGIFIPLTFMFDLNIILINWTSILFGIRHGEVKSSLELSMLKSPTKLKYSKSLLKCNAHSMYSLFPEVHPIMCQW